MNRENCTAQNVSGREEFERAQKPVGEVLRDEPSELSVLRHRASPRLRRAQLAIADLNDALTTQPRSLDLMLPLADAYERSGLVELPDQLLAAVSLAPRSQAEQTLGRLCIVRLRRCAMRPSIV